MSVLTRLVQSAREVCAICQYQMFPDSQVIYCPAEGARQNETELRRCCHCYHLDCVLQHLKVTRAPPSGGIRQRIIPSCPQCRIPIKFLVPVNRGWLFSVNIIHALSSTHDGQEDFCQVTPLERIGFPLFGPSNEDGHYGDGSSPTLNGINFGSIRDPTLMNYADGEGDDDIVVVEPDENDTDSDAESVVFMGEMLRGESRAPPDQQAQEGSNNVQPEELEQLEQQAENVEDDANLPSQSSNDIRIVSVRGANVESALPDPSDGNSASGGASQSPQPSTSREGSRASQETSMLESYPCRLCPRLFRYRSTRASHEKVHKGIVLRCDICNVTFTAQSSLHRHNAKFHSQN